MKYLLSVFTLATLLAFAADPPRKIRIWMMGDSTMSVKEKRAYPETGWGMPFEHFWDSTVIVENRARNGRSTRTFIEEGRWNEVASGMQAGDYLFIQFGHNDESKEKTDRYTDPESYRNNLRLFIRTARARQVQPILFTPVSRRRFDSTGKALPTHEEYSALVREVAAAENLPLIDLDLISQRYYQQLGPETSKLLFLQLEPGEHPNYPEGKNDNTHFSELGARKIAQLVLQEIKKLPLELKQRIVQPAKK